MDQYHFAYFHLAYIFNFFWIGDIKTDFMDIALYTECKTLFLRSHNQQAYSQNNSLKY